MPFTADIVDELNVLMHFNLATTQEGIKVHKSAEPEVIAATNRLYHKGLLTQKDGGYLTDLGRQAAEAAAAVLTLLTAAE